MTWTNRNIAIVGACAAIVVAALVYVTAKKRGPARSLWTGQIKNPAAAAVELQAHVGAGHF